MARLKAEIASQRRGKLKGLSVLAGGISWFALRRRKAES